MLGRRQIREKVIKSLYSYEQNPINHNVLEQRMLADFEGIYQLYVYQLNFLVALKQVAEKQMELGKSKFLKTEEDLNPNQKFVRNQALIRLEENRERLSFSSSHKEFVWDIHDDLLLKIFNKIKGSKLFADYMQNSELSFLDDQKFIGKVFLRYIAENDDFHDHLEGMEISWADDFHITNSMVQKTIGFMKENQPIHTLLQTLKDAEDREFAQKLLRSTLNQWEEIQSKIEERLENWDIDRIGTIDKIVLSAAIAELDNFPLTPAPIIINEYVEIVKAFATEKSQIFVNGILDRYVKDNNRN